MSRTDNDIDWSLTSWEGRRRVQLRRWLALTVREWLQAIEEMAELSGRSWTEAGSFLGLISFGGRKLTLPFAKRRVVLPQKHMPAGGEAPLRHPR